MSPNNIADSGSSKEAAGAWLARAYLHFTHSCSESHDVPHSVRLLIVDIIIEIDIYSPAWTVNDCAMIMPETARVSALSSLFDMLKVVVHGLYKLCGDNRAKSSSEIQLFLLFGPRVFWLVYMRLGCLIVSKAPTYSFANRY